LLDKVAVVSKFESIGQSRTRWGGVGIASVLLAGGLSTGLLIYKGVQEHEELAHASQEVSTLLDKAGYQPFFGDMNGPDEYDEPLAEAKDERDGHQSSMLWYSGGAVTTGGATVAGLWYIVHGLRRESPA
jgi:hypothetical protein